MNENILNKIDILVKDAEEQKNKVVASSKVSSIIYVLLAVFVVGYTTFLYLQIEKAVTNDNVSAILRVVVSEQLAHVPAMLDDLVDKEAEPLADAVVAAIYDQIPTLESKAKNLIREHSGSLISQIQSDLFPQFHSIIQGNYADIKAAAEALTDEKSAKELARIFVKKIMEEIDHTHGLITSEAQGKVDEINKHLEGLVSKPASELTNKEASQKRLIVAWLYLIDREQGLDKILRTIINRTGYTWEYLMQESGIADAVKESLEGDITVE